MASLQQSDALWQYGEVVLFRIWLYFYFLRAVVNIPYKLFNFAITLISQDDHLEDMAFMPQISYFPA